MDQYIFQRSERDRFLDLCRRIFAEHTQFSGTFDDRGVMRMSVHPDIEAPAPLDKVALEVPEQQVA